MIRRLPSWLAPVCWFVALAVLVTWPLVLSPFSRLAALQGPGDPYLNLWILGWDLHTISDAPLKLFNGRVFDANIFHPARQTLTYSDNFLLQALLVWPAFALTGDIVFCYNLVFFASLLACAIAMFAFVRSVTGSIWAATIAGTAWGFWPYHVAHLAHLQLQALYVLPLAFFFMHRLVAARKTRDAVGLGVMAGLQAIASVYWGVIGAVALLVSTFLLARGAGGRRVGLLIRKLVLAGVVGLVVVAPVLWPYLQAQQREGFGRNLYEAARHAATWRSYLTVPEVNAVYGATGVLRFDPTIETELFPGLVVIALAIVGGRYARRQGSRPLALSCYGLIVVGIVLSLGPDGIRPLYAFLQRWVFGFQAIRAPARFAVIVTFGLTLLAALGVREVMARAKERATVAAIVLLALMTIEYVNVPLAWVEAPPRSTQIGRWLADAPQPGPVLYLPLTIDYENTPFMVESLEHMRPIVNGYSGQRPSFYAALVDTMHEFPSADAFWTLHDLDVRFLVSSVPLNEAIWPLRERARLNEPRVGDRPPGEPRLVYELIWSEEIEARLGEPVVPEPPPPGPIPFAPGEEATYRVDWQGPAGTMNAGTIVLSVEPGTPAQGTPAQGTPAQGTPAQGTPALRLHVRARTAPWISRFFEADDEFITDVSADLMSVRHERRLREGRKVVNEVSVFDREARQLRWESDATKPPLRFWPGARDPIAAFYYLRTLPLQPGTRVQVPVNDNGRNINLDVQVERVERVTIGGREQSALRVRPTLRQRVSRRSSPDITVWLSDDVRRLPLAADVRAGFGTVRLELERVTPATPAAPAPPATPATPGTPSH
jgi:hypothetical protein